MKKTLALLFTICLLMASTLGVYAVGDEPEVQTIDVQKALGDKLYKEYLKALKKIEDQAADKEIKEVFEEYNLEEINLEEMPEGTTYIKVNNEKELQALLQVIKSIPKNVHKEYKFDKKDLKKSNGSDDGEVQPLVTYGTVHRSVVGWDNVWSQVELHANIDVAYEGSFRWITGCHEWTTYTGMTVGFSWDEEYCYHNINDGGISVNVYGGGTMSWVIYVEGIGTVYREPVNMSLYYSVY